MVSKKIYQSFWRRGWRMLNHKQKVKLARKLSGRQTGHFDSPEWEKRRNIIAQRVKRKESKKN